MRRNETCRGFTLLELLVVLAVFSILAGIAASTLVNLRQNLILEEAAQAVNQAIQRARAESLISRNCTDFSQCWRFRISSTNGYVLEEYVGSWKIKETKAFPTMYAFTNGKAGDTVTFSTRGLANFNLNGSVAGELRLSNGKTTLRVIPSMVGASRVIKL